MARTMVKTKRPFDNLIYWNEYIDYINREFSEPEEKSKWTPQVNIKVKDGTYQLSLNIPGFSLKDIKIKYKEGFMTIEGHKSPITSDGNMHNQKNNAFYNNFKSVVRFPKGIQSNRIKKVLKGNILEIQVPEPIDQPASH